MMNEFLLNLMADPLFGSMVVALSVALSNICMCLWLKNHNAKILSHIEDQHIAERNRATEVANALRGIIYAFSEAQQQDSQEQTQDRLNHHI